MSTQTKPEDWYQTLHRAEELRRAYVAATVRDAIAKLRRRS